MAERETVPVEVAWRNLLLEVTDTVRYEILHVHVPVTPNPAPSKVIGVLASGPEMAKSWETEQVIWVL